MAPDPIQHEFEDAQDSRRDAGALQIEIERLAALPSTERVFQKRQVAARFKISIAEISELIRAAQKEAAERAERLKAEAAAKEYERQKAEAEAQAESAAPADDKAVIDELYEKAKPVLEADDPFAAIDNKIKESGYAGDRIPPKLCYLTGLSGLMRHPIKVNLQGPSAAGKNHAYKTGLKLLPADEAFYEFQASSPMALVYSPHSFKHKVVVVAEADSIPKEGPPASAMRSLFEDDEMRYPTVDRDPETHQLVTRDVVKEGPTGAITTSTKPLEWQMGTRFLAADIPDDPEQTLKVLLAEAEAANRLDDAIDLSLEPFHAAYRWLRDAGVKNIKVPFAKSLARLVPRKDVRIRRDFKQVLAVTQTIAFLAQRKRDESDGWIVATVDDYASARALLTSALDKHTNDGITDAVRKVFEAVDAELKDPDKPITVSLPALGERMGVTKSTAHYRARRAIASGYLVNAEERKGHPMKLQLGDPLPSQESVLPTVDELNIRIDIDQAAQSKADKKRPPIEQSDQEPQDNEGAF